MKRTLKILSPFLITGAIFVLFVFAINKYLNFHEDLKRKNTRDNLLELLIAKKSRLDKALSSRIYYTKGVAAYVSLNPTIREPEFQDLAKELIQNDTVIHTMSLAKNGIINAMYPKEGNEAAIGLNLLEHPERRVIVERTILTKKTFVAGPVELVEGGIAFISYTPIFYKTGEKYGDFWGMTDIVINRNNLFKEAGLYKPEESFVYAIRGTDGKGKKGGVFWGNPDVFKNNPVNVDITLPTGNWVLAGIPLESGSDSLNDTDVLRIVLFISAIVISILIFLLSRSILKLQENKEELKVLFGSMKEIVIEFDENGVYRSVAPTNEKLLIMPANELKGKSLYEVFNRQTAEFFHNAIKECIEKEETIEIEYPLKLKNKEHKFTARLSYMPGRKVIYVAQDNTEKIKAQEKLKQSEKSLKELNDVKDKFFSIIAHDLKNPLGSYMNLTDILYSGYDEIDDAEKKEIVLQLKNSSKNIYSLLENLLQWSRSQRGKIQFNPEMNDLQLVIENVINLSSLKAKEKNIIIEAVYQGNLEAEFDANMITAVIRNFVSNALKFTKSGGKIVVSGIELEKGVRVSVKDSGVGIPADKIKNLFSAGVNNSTPGTDNESGTGLGLVICQDFAEKHGTSIEVQSKESAGSEFSFYLQKILDS